MDGHGMCSHVKIGAFLALKLPYAIATSGLQFFLPFKR
jgi:hypothetical protein